MSDLEKKDKIIMSIVYGLMVLSCAVIFFVIYNVIQKEKPWTLGVTYASLIDFNGEKQPILKVNIKSNKNNNGKALYDMQFNSYSDTEGNGITGFGIQCIGDWKIINNSGYEDFAYSTNRHNESVSTDDSIVEMSKKYSTHVFGQTAGFGDFYFYYTGDNGTVYLPLSKERIDDYLLISIDSSYYKVELKSYTCEVINDSGWAWLPWVPDNKKINTKFSWLEVFDIVMRSAMDSSASTSMTEFDLSLIDLSDIITISKKNDKGQYESLSKTAEIKNYFNIRVNYSLDGANSVEDSMFGMVASSSTWSSDNFNKVENYWSAYADITLTEKHLNYVLNEEEGLYYATIDETFADYLKGLFKSNKRLFLDFRKLDFDVYGIDLMNFDFKIESFNIVTSVEDFVIYNQYQCDIVPTIMVV